MNFKEPLSLDLREVPGPARHQLVFNAWEMLSPGESFTIRNDHDPVPLRRQLEQIAGGTLEWEYLEKEPYSFQFRITRKATVLHRPCKPCKDGLGNIDSLSGRLSVTSHANQRTHGPRGPDPPTVGAVSECCGGRFIRNGTGIVCIWFGGSHVSAGSEGCRSGSGDTLENRNAA